MSKVLIDRELLERAVYRLEVIYDADSPIVCDLSALLTAPSGTPAIPVKAYYHEWTDLEGVRTRSVGLEVRKEFTDAPLVLEADALVQIACLEGEIAKRDEELASCRIAVENCELFRARIGELESRYQRDVYGLNNEGDPIGGDPAGGYANDNARLRSELAAIKVQDTVGEVVGWYRLDRPYEMTSYPSVCATWHKLGAPVAPLYAAPVSEAKTQGVDGLEVFQFDWDTCNSISNGWPDDVFPLIESLPYDPLCRLADAKAIIDGLRGKVGSQRVKTCIALKERNDALKERDQQAQRIGELTAALELISNTDPDDGTAWFHGIADAALSASKE